NNTESERSLLFVSICLHFRFLSKKKNILPLLWRFASSSLSLLTLRLLSKSLFLGDNGSNQRDSYEDSSDSDAFLIHLLPTKCSSKFRREMKDFPSCFGENGVQVADSSSSNSGKNAQNLVTCIYQFRIRGRTCLITVTWAKTLMGQSVTVGVDDSCNQSLCKVEIKPWLFTKRKGSKSLEVYSCSIDVVWDLASAKFGSGPEALGGFYVGVVVDKEMVLLLGDMKKEAFKKTNASPSSRGAVFIAKKEHVFGKREFATKAQLCSDGVKVHDLVIECDTSVTDPCLVVRVDGKTLLQVKRLKWKFRGNDTIVVNRMAVEVLWDVHSWLFGMPSSAGNAVFMFRTCQSSSDKSLSFSQDVMTTTTTNSKSQSSGFSLILYAWKNE
ncbi:hypothetical protein IGI04_033286, partial [Brassica rapa subsp. trilocularis]